MNGPWYFGFAKIFGLVTNTIVANDVHLVFDHIFVYYYNNSIQVSIVVVVVVW